MSIMNGSTSTPISGMGNAAGARRHARVSRLGRTRHQEWQNRARAIWPGPQPEGSMDHVVVVINSAWPAAWSEDINAVRMTYLAALRAATH
jgi:hypothetical protein